VKDSQSVKARARISKTGLLNVVAERLQFVYICIACFRIWRTVCTSR